MLGDDFLLVEYCGMYQIHLYVFVRASHAHHVSKIAISKVPTFRTSYGAMGNATPKMLAQRKGGVAVSFNLGGSSFCFVAAHLAAHQGERGQMLERNRDCARILKELDLRGDGTDTCACFDHVVLCGDLNYRLGPPELSDNAELSTAASYWREVADEAAAEAWGALYARDQLQAQIRAGHVLHGFEDGGPYAFPPSFKLTHDEKKGRPLSSRSPCLYSVKRVPSYTDRVLLLSQPGKPALRRLAQGTAGDGRDGHEQWTESDHLPVWSVFSGSYMLRAAAVLDEGFEETWLLSLTSLQVRVAIGALREGHGDATAEGGWEHLCGDRLPMTEHAPLLSATLTASFLSREAEHLGAPLPPGTLPAGSGSDAELTARWEGGEFPLSPMASQRGLAWLKPETLRLQLFASNGGNARIPLGSAAVSVAAACRAAPPHIVQPAGPEGTACTAALEVVAPLSAFGCYAGEATLGFRFRISDEAAAEAAEVLAREGRARGPPPHPTRSTSAASEHTRRTSPAGTRWRPHRSSGLVLGSCGGGSTLSVDGDAEDMTPRVSEVSALRAEPSFQLGVKRLLSLARGSVASHSIHRGHHGSTIDGAPRARDTKPRMDSLPSPREPDPSPPELEAHSCDSGASSSEPPPRKSSVLTTRVSGVTVPVAASPPPPPPPPPGEPPPATPTVRLKKGGAPVDVI